MADNNKQNSGTENKQSSGDNKQSTGGAASTQQAKEADSTSNKSGSQSSSTGGSTASQSGSITDSAKDALSQVKESAGSVAGDAIGQVKDKAASVLDDQKATLASGVASVADSVRQIGENLGGSGENNQVAALAGKYGDNLASQIEKFSSYLDDKEIKELVTDVEQFAKRNPLLFVGGAFALGVLAARFLKSSGRKKSSGKRS